MDGFFDYNGNIDAIIGNDFKVSFFLSWKNKLSSLLENLVSLWI